MLCQVIFFNDQINNNNKILTMCNEQGHLKQHNPVAVKIEYLWKRVKRFKPNLMLFKNNLNEEEDGKQ